MRRVYNPPKKQRRVVEDALREMRAAQDALGPEFIDKIKLLVKDYDPASLIPTAKAGRNDIRIAQHGSEPIDRKNNLLIIMKFLKMNQENKNVQTQIRTLLSENKTIH